METRRDQREIERDLSAEWITHLAERVVGHMRAGDNLAGAHEDTPAYDSPTEIAQTHDRLGKRRGRAVTTEGRGHRKYRLSRIHPNVSTSTVRRSDASSLLGQAKKTDHQDASLRCYGDQMRTTISIDDELYRAVKEQAARSGRTIGEIIEDAVRRSLSRLREQTGGPLPPLPTYGGSGVLPGVDLTSNAALRDVMDAGESVDALR